MHHHFPQRHEVWLWNMFHTHHDKEVAAYYLWEKLGKPEGNDVAIWLIAERDLRMMRKSAFVP